MRMRSADDASAHRWQQSTLMQASRDLHDRVGPGIAAALQRLELLALESGNRRPVSASFAWRLRECSLILRTALQDASDVGLRLRPATASQSAGYSGQSIVRELDMLTKDDASFPRLDAEEEVFLIVREALRNSFNHSGATEVVVRLVRSDSHVVITVDDDGCGFDSASPQGSSLGLACMGERAIRIEADLQMESSFRSGTKVKLIVPLGSSGSE